MPWHNYEEAREQRDDLRRQLARLRSGGDVFEQLLPERAGQRIVHTFWGQAWCDQLERHEVYENRLPRGRSYLRQGNVYNLKIAPGEITAQVAGAHMYDVRVTMSPLAADQWERLKAECAGQVPSLLDLLSGQLGPGVLKAVTDPEHGLFPEPSEIRFSCTCPDAADLCKHVAATLYGVGVLLDRKPELFFTLRSVDPGELLAGHPLAGAPGTDAALAGEDLGALFGIALAEDETGAVDTPKHDS